MTFDPSPEEVAKWDSLITRVSRGISRDFPDIEADDLYQDLWEDVVKSEYHIYLKEPWMKSFLNKRCRFIAWDRRKDYLQWSSQYSYRPSDIRIMLNRVYNRDEWDQFFVPQDAREEEQRSARLDMAVDLSWALDKLPDHYRNIIQNHYEALVQYEKDSAEAKMLYRAELRLTEILNQYRGQQQPPKARRVISNANANYKLQEQNGD